MIREKKNLARERKEKRETKRKKEQEKLDNIKSILIKNRESESENKNIQGWTLDKNDNPILV